MRELAFRIGITPDLARSESQNALAMSASRHGWNFGEGQLLSGLGYNLPRSRCRREQSPEIHLLTTNTKMAVDALFPRPHCPRSPNHTRLKPFAASRARPVEVSPDRI
jgi:hypothetical protein